MTTRSDSSARVRRGVAAASSLGSLVLAVLVPKCPLCVAAWLSAIGVGAATAAVAAPWLRPASLVVMLAIVVAACWFERRGLGRARRERHDCCDGRPTA